MVPKSKTRLLSNGRSPWSVRKRKGDALEEEAAIPRIPKSGAKRRWERLGKGFFRSTSRS